MNMEKQLLIGKRVETQTLDVQQFIHAGIFGPSKHVMKDHLLSELKNKMDAQIMTFSSDPSNRTELPKINPLAVPKGMTTSQWSSVLSRLLCESFGLDELYGKRSFYLLFSIINDVLERCKRNDSVATFKHVVTGIEIEYDKRISRLNEGNLRMPFDEQSLFQSTKERFNCFMKVNNPLYQTTCAGPFANIDNIVEEKRIIDFNFSHFPFHERVFLTKVIAMQEFYYCKYNQKHLAEPLVIVFENASSLFEKNDFDDLFDELIREARNYNIYFIFTALSDKQLPNLVSENLPLKFHTTLDRECVFEYFGKKQTIYVPDLDVDNKFKVI